MLIGYQNEMFEVIRSETDAPLVELHATLPSILSELDGVEPIDRSSMNAFEDKALRDAVESTRASTSQ